MSDTPTKTQVMLAKLAIALVVGFAVMGVALYGVSADVFRRIWQNLLDRPGGPMTFRFILQPVMAAIAALMDGIKDARTGRGAYLSTMLTRPETVGGRLGEALVATARVILLGLGMDVVYQFLVFGVLHPGEAAIMAILLAFLPYVLLRGPMSRVARWWFGAGPAASVR